MNPLLRTLLRSLPVVGPVIAATQEFKALYDAAAALLSEDDQQAAKESYADLIANNDEGHRRLQQKLQAAAQRG